MIRLILLVIATLFWFASHFVAIPVVGAWLPFICFILLAWLVLQPGSVRAPNSSALTLVVALILTSLLATSAPASAKMKLAGMTISGHVDLGWLAKIGAQAFTAHMASKAVKHKVAPAATAAPPVAPLAPAIAPVPKPS